MTASPSSDLSRLRRRTWPCFAPHAPLDEAAADEAFETIIGAFSDNLFDFTHLAMTLWANAAAFPGLKPTDVFTEAGAKAVDDIMREMRSRRRRYDKLYVRG